MVKQMTQGFQLAPQQKQRWRAQHFGGVSDRTKCAVLMTGNLSINRLKAAVDSLVGRFAILRTSFRHFSGMNYPLQVVDNPAPLFETGPDIKKIADGQGDPDIDSLIDRAIQFSEEAAQESQSRFSVFKIDPGRNLLLIDLPSLSADRIGMRNLVGYISSYYGARSRDLAIEEEPLQYLIASEWFNELLESEDARDGIIYWRKQDISNITSIKLPIERSNAEMALFQPGSLSVTLEGEMASGIERTAEAYDIPVSTFLLGVWQILLARLTGGSRIAVGTSFDGRTDEELQQALGLFAKYLPIVMDLRESTPLPALMKSLNEKITNASEWQECFVWENVKAHSPSDPPARFFPYCFEFYGEPAELKSDGLTFKVCRESACLDRFKLGISCMLKENAIDVEFQYDPMFYSRPDIARLTGQLQKTIESVLADPGAAIGDLEIVGEIERHQLLVEFNKTDEYLGADRCIHDLFEEQVSRTPHNVAVIFDGQQLTYAELSERANRLAGHLVSLGVGPEVIVGLCVDRSIEMLVGLLAILKSGGAYVPLDPMLPKERLAYMLADTQAPVLLIQEHLENSFPEHSARIIHLDSQLKSIPASENGSAAREISPDKLAYVIYTSGSTGKPKGVLVSHRSITNRLLWMRSAFPLTEADAVLQKTVFSFDASVWELFVPLLSGGRVVMARPGGHQDAAYMLGAVAEHKITTLQVVPSMLQVLLQEQALSDCKSLKRVFCGGEPLPLELQERFFERVSADLYNLYGPTEVSIDATSWKCCPVALCEQTGPIVPIGRPLSNVQVYILDDRLRPVPVGSSGEIYVGGKGLARGYLSRPDLTAEKFLPNPFANTPGARLYKTGDIARHHSDGSIEFVGRIDHQVKIRGYRIEPGEIETTLRLHPGVADAVAVAREDSTGQPRLVAYVVPSNQRTLKPGREGLYRLPNGMEIAQLNRNETELLYEEIFIQQEYAQHGIVLTDGDCVIDAGANIGLFALYVHNKIRGAKVFSVEPIPVTFDVLKTNFELYGVEGKAINCGLSGGSGEAEFTFYPKVSASSGMFANAAEDSAVTRAFIGNKGELMRSFADELLEGRFEEVKFTCRLRTLSEIIGEESIDRVDLLKIDVEKSELEVLKGIEEGDWARIKQIVMEVHDKDDRLRQITDLLIKHGFEYQVDQNPSFDNTGLYNIYASHPSHFAERSAKSAVTDSHSPDPHQTTAALSTGDLRRYLAEKLPDYMVPSAFVLLDHLPLASNGKLDRQALPAPGLDRPELDGEFVSPENTIEEMLALIWSDVLAVEEVGRNDNFFDLGGHSLLATQLVSRIRKIFKVEVPLRSLFESPTVAGLAQILEELQKAGQGLAASPILPVPREGDLPLSFAQQRLWFLDQLEPDSFFYNVPSAIRLTGSLDIRALEASLNEIARRHEALRTSFGERDSIPFQNIAPALSLTLPVIDLSCFDESERISIASKMATEEAQTPFDLSRGPLLRAKLIKLGEQDHVALFTLHHIVSDGWSIGVLVREVTALYEAYIENKPSTLHELPIQYADFAAWQRDWLQGDAFDRQLDYWKRKLGGRLNPLELPTDFPRPAVQSYRGKRHSILIPDTITNEIKRFSRKQSVTPFMVLVAALKVLLRHYTGQDDIIVGSDVANRNRAEIEGLIGFFTNQLVLRDDLSGDPSFVELLGRVRETTLEAYAHQDFPFDKLVEALKPERNLSRTPLFQIKVVLQNTPLKPLALPGLTLSPIEFEGGTAKFDLTLFLEEGARGIYPILEYNSDLFEAATAVQILEKYEFLLGRIIADPEARLSRLEADLEEFEREKLRSERLKLEANNLTRFKKIKPKTVLPPREEAVRAYSLRADGLLPLVIEPNLETLDLVEWAKLERASVEEKLSRHGAVLFRGFNVKSAARFEKLASVFCDRLFNENGEHPRKTVSGNVYTPVFYPPEQLLLWHNENSFNHRWPSKIWFCCVEPALEGGETPIVDSRKVYQLLDPGIRRRMIERGVMYVRNYGDGLGLDWQTVFQTESRAEVERKCIQARMIFEWRGANKLRTSCVRPAVVNHPGTGEMVWFNQAQHWHISCLPQEARESLLEAFNEEDLPRNCYYGDGSKIEDSVMAEILSIYRSLQVTFPWQSGDVLMLDNLLTAHGRNPYVGGRKLLVTMGEMLTFDDVSSTPKII